MTSKEWLLYGFYLGGGDEESGREGYLPAPIRGRKRGEIIGIGEGKGGY